MTLVQVHNTEVHPDDTPRRYQRVVVALAGRGFNGDGTQTTGRTATDSDVDGLASFDLVPNNDGEYYVWNHPDGSQDKFVVPGTGGPFALETLAILTPPPSLPQDGVTTGQMLASLAPLVSTAQVQSFTDEEKAQARANIDANALPGLINFLYFGGDSLMASIIGGCTPWPPNVASALGLGSNYLNAGQGGQSSSEIAIRFGALDVVLSVTADTIPSSGVVSVPTVTTTGIWRPVDHAWTGTLCGVVGVLEHDNTGGNWTFTRSAPGSTVACPPGSVFHCTEADTLLSAMIVMWAGQNDPSSDPDLSITIRDVDLMRQRVSLGNWRVLWMGLYMRASEPYQTWKTQYNQILADRFGDNYLDMATFGCQTAPVLIGQALTTSELTDQAGGRVPASLLQGDGTHPVQAFFDVIGDYVTQKIRELGWVTGAVPALPLTGEPVAMTSVSATTTTLTATIPQFTGAVGYKVLYRPSGNTVWLYGTNVLDSGSSTTSVTIPSSGAMLPGTSYDLTYEPYNIDGEGPLSDVLTTATSGTPPVVITSDSFPTNLTNITGHSTDAHWGGTAAVYATSNANVDVVSGQATGHTPTTGGFAAVTSTAGTPTDGRSKITLKALPASSFMYVCARGTWSGTTLNGYRVSISSGGSLRIVVQNGGTQTTLVGPSPNGTTVPGDIIGLSVVGTLLTLYLNGAVYYQTNDTTFASGSLFGFSVANAGAIDDFIVYDK